ncbi:hypothetical protein GQ53DRAFT_148015 [Thozetella sp. PMI_491]|nr:hypothetical protein GQ53DRAFT_148015 [Thozetella sp. PMI_491]
MIATVMGKGTSSPRSYGRKDTQPIALPAHQKIAPGLAPEIEHSRFDLRAKSRAVQRHNSCEPERADEGILAPTPLSSRPLKSFSLMGLDHVEDTFSLSRLQHVLPTAPGLRKLAILKSSLEGSPPALDWSEPPSTVSTPSSIPNTPDASSGCIDGTWPEMERGNRRGIAHASPESRNSAGLNIIKNTTFNQVAISSGERQIGYLDELQRHSLGSGLSRQSSDWASFRSPTPRNADSVLEAHTGGILSGNHESLGAPCTWTYASHLHGNPSNQASSESNALPAPPSTSTWGESSSQRALLKRKRGKDDSAERDDDDEGDSDNDGNSKKPRKTEKGHPDTRPFACPFYRMDPYHHMECINYRLTRIRDVKQHLARKHYQPPLYCPSCYQTFPSPPGRDEHIRSRRCEPRSPATMDDFSGVSQEAQERLSHRVDRSVSSVEQWYILWDILFPISPKPPTPFVGTLFQESFDMIRDFWEKEGLDMVNKLFATVPDAADDRRLPELMVSLFGAVQDRLEQMVQGGTFVSGRGSAQDSRQNSIPGTKSLSDQYSGYSGLCVGQSSSDSSRSQACSLQSERRASPYEEDLFLRGDELFPASDFIDYKAAGQDILSLDRPLCLSTIDIEAGNIHPDYEGNGSEALGDVRTAEWLLE